MTKHIAQLAACIALLTASAPAWAGECLPCTEVGGQISKDTTWHLADSPYCVTPDAGGSILIGSGATLTIEAGVEVRFKTGMGITVGSIPFGPGCLVARGTEALPIVFTTNDPCEDPPGTADPGDWGRIFFTDNACDAVFDGQGEYESGGILEYVIVEYAGSGGPAITAENCSPYLGHCEVHHNTDWGISVNASGAGDVKIEDSVVRDNGGGGIGITAATAGAVNVEYCVVHDNGGGTGISVTATGGGVVNIEYCQVHDHPNGRGISVAPGGAHVTIEYCEIARCTVNSHGGGIALWSGGTDHIVRNNVIEDCVANTADWNYGGGMFIDARTTLEGNSVTGCTARAAGGIALWDDSDGSHLSANEVTGNTATHWHNWSNRQVGAGGIYLWYSGNCTLTGNTVTDNRTTTTSGSSDHRGAGGGIALVESSGCTLTQNTVTWNSTSGPDARGGGVFLVNSGSCLIQDNTVTGNSTSGQWAYGGGIFLESSTSCLLRDNTVSGNSTSGGDAHGGGICLRASGTGTTDPESGLRGNTVADNVMTGNDAKGGGIFVWNSGNTILESNSITGNHASGAGTDAGGIGVWSSASCILTENTITDNTCGDLGGGILFDGSGSCTLTSNTITGNTCGNEGGGLRFWNSGRWILESNIITNNTAGGNAGGIYFGNSGCGGNDPECTMTDSVIACNQTNGSTGGIYVTNSTSLSFAGNDVKGIYNTIARNDGYCVWNNNPYDPSGINDIHAEYVNWCTEDPGQIQACIWDFFDDASLAFVLWNPPAPPGPECCPWDLNCDDSVGILDLLALLAAWGTDPGGPPDFDGDGTVGILDLLALLANWGPCP